jgi:modulator of FtsH protease
MSNRGYGSQFDYYAPPAVPSVTVSAYLRKVYSYFLAGILFCAFGALVALNVGTPVVVGAGIAVPPVVLAFVTNPILAIGGFLAILGATFAVRALRDVPVINVASLLGYTFLFGLWLAPTIFLAMLRASMGDTIDTHPVGDAFLLASAGFSGLTVYVFTTKKDFSYLGGFLSMGLLVLIGALFLNFFFQSSFLTLAFSVVGVLLFGGYILYDTSRLIHKRESYPAICAAQDLFLDFVNLFVFLLRILSSRRN